MGSVPVDGSRQDGLPGHCGGASKAGRSGCWPARTVKTRSARWTQPREVTIPARGTGFVSLVQTLFAIIEFI